MFITFEGPEGAGKSSVVSAVAKRLRDAGVDVLTTREPGHGPIGSAIRDILLHGENMSAKAELFLFLADRSQHVASVIRPALAEGKLVLCDRYSDSTYVYQAVARGLDRRFIDDANEFATEGLVPDRTFLLDVTPEIGLARLSKKDRLDGEPIEFHRRVREAFVSLASQNPVRWKVIDASCPLEEVVERVWRTLDL